jgi:hypothetical protein
VTEIPDVEKFSFKDRNRYHRHRFERDVSMPIFWDPIFLEKKLRLIKAWGAAFGRDQRVTTVNASCANSSSGDWGFPADTQEDVRNWKRLGYSSAKLIEACKRTIDATAAAFPGTVIVLSIGQTRVDDPTDIVANAAVDHGYARYGGRFMAMRSTLSARTPDPSTTKLRNVWKTVYDRRPRVGAQMLWYVTGDKTFRMAGGKSGPEPEILERAIRMGLQYEMFYLEIYQEDLLNPQMQQLVARTADSIERQDPRGGSVRRN